MRETMKKRELSEIDEKEEFWAGTLLRKYNVGLKVPDKNDDYYDYMLAYANWESNSMMLVNITRDAGSNKAGSVYSGVLPINKSIGKAVVTKNGFIHTLGEDLADWYVLDNY